MNITITGDHMDRMVTVSDIGEDSAKKIVQYASDLHFGVKVLPEPYKADPSITTLDEQGLRKLAYLIKLQLQCSDNKIEAIKSVRFMFHGTSLKDAKDFVYWVADSRLEAGSIHNPPCIAFNYSSPNIPSWVSWVYPGKDY